MTSNPSPTLARIALHDDGTVLVEFPASSVTTVRVDIEDLEWIQRTARDAEARWHERLSP